VYDPANPARPSWPVERTGDDWRVHNDVGLKGGGPESRLVSLGLFRANPRVARLLAKKDLGPQKPGHCFLDHSQVAQKAAGLPDGRVRPINQNKPLTARQLSEELNKGPLVMSGRNVARPDSQYVGMHTIALIDEVKLNGRHYVLGIDLDDTIARVPVAQDLANGNFGGVLYDPDQLVGQATPYIDPDTGNQLEMYQRVEPGLAQKLKQRFGGASNAQDSEAR
jgi:hypothetical protein